MKTEFVKDDCGKPPALLHYWGGLAEVYPHYRVLCTLIEKLRKSFTQNEMQDIGLYCERIVRMLYTETNCDHLNVCAVYLDGATKYGADNFMQPELDIARFGHALARHALDLIVYDKEFTDDTKLPHCAAIIANALILIILARDYKEEMMEFNSMVKYN